jgi:hypothetical protein
MIIIVSLAHYDSPAVVFLAAALVALAAKLPLATLPLFAFAAAL